MPVRHSARADRLLNRPFCAVLGPGLLGGVDTTRAGSSAGDFARDTERLRTAVRAVEAAAAAAGDNSDPAHHALAWSNWSDRLDSFVLAETFKVGLHCLFLAR